MEISWIPHEWVAPLLIIKGVLAAIGVILLVIHTNKVVPGMSSRGQKGRYYILLAYAMLSAAATIEQLDQPVTTFGYRNLVALVLNAGLVWVCIQSMRDERHGKWRG